MHENSDVEDAYWCVVSGSEVWTVDGVLPRGSAMQLGLSTYDAYFIGKYSETPVYWINDAEIEQSLEMSSLRALLHLENELFHLVSRAVQYGHMTNSQRFCPQCGGRNYFHPREYAMQCHECKVIHYPKIYPCIIVAIRRNNQILLAHHIRHQHALYTVIAGFVEVGETLEDCVQREVQEETGLYVKNIRYVGSQPWAFPSSLMIGFLADYDSGELEIDLSELKDAQWFDVNKLPNIPPTGTIARFLIEKTVEEIQRSS